MSWFLSMTPPQNLPCDSNYIISNLGMELGMALKFYINVAKGLKLIVRKFCGVIPTFLEVAGEKMLGRNFWHPHSE